MPKLGEINSTIQDPLARYNAVMAIPICSRLNREVDRQANAASCGVIWVRSSIGSAIISSVFSSKASRSAHHTPNTRDDGCLAAAQRAGGLFAQQHGIVMLEQHAAGGRLRSRTAGPVVKCSECNRSPAAGRPETPGVAALGDAYVPAARLPAAIASERPRQELLKLRQLPAFGGRALPDGTGNFTTFIASPQTAAGATRDRSRTEARARTTRGSTLSARAQGSMLSVGTDRSRSPPGK